MDWKYRLKVSLHGRTWTCRSWHTCSLTWFPSCSLFLLWDVKLRSKLEFFCWKYKGEEMLTWRYLILADLPYCKKVCCTCSASISDIMGSSPFTNSLIKQNKFNIILSMHLVEKFWTLYLVHFCTVQYVVCSIQIHIKISQLVTKMCSKQAWSNSVNKLQQCCYKYLEKFFLLFRI
jgi:hypothetical protein